MSVRASEPTFGVVVPVKPPAVGKSRLSALPHEERAELAMAFAVDTVTAVLGCPVVARVMVVTDDARFARELARLGTWVIPDGVGGQLNGTLELAAAELHRRAPGLRVAAVFADLPALTSEELALALAAAAPRGMSFVADAAGTGSTMVAAADLASFQPRFGPGSRQAHVDAGAFEITIPCPGLRHDVDTADDVVAVLRLGVGPRTSQVAALLRP
jgi:2-phospho-L-lactate/phosphoenolpyruvate guanylyltransferase